MRLADGMTAEITGRTPSAVIVTIAVDMPFIEAELARLGLDLEPWQVEAIAHRYGSPSPDAHRYDASRAEAEQEMAEWRAILDGAKGR